MHVVSIPEWMTLSSYDSVLNAPFVCDFQRRSNHIVHNFKMCDSKTLCHIFSSQIESFYGCELFNYSMSYMSKLYVSWRKIIRHIIDCLRRHIIILFLKLKIVLLNVWTVDCINIFLI